VIHADEILVLEAGRIVERGRHASCWRGRQVCGDVAPPAGERRAGGEALEAVGS